MDVRLPIESWVSYTVDRFVCTIVDTDRPNTGDAIYLGCHQLINTGFENGLDMVTARAAVDMTVRGFVEAARVAYNASEYPEGRDDNTLVPKSCVLYLDNAISYWICDTYGLNRLNGLIGGTLQHGKYSGDYKEAWVDCMVFLRSIRTQYCDVISDSNNAVVSELGAPWYMLTPSSGRRL